MLLVRPGWNCYAYWTDHFHTDQQLCSNHDMTNAIKLKQFKLRTTKNRCSQNMRQSKGLNDGVLETQMIHKISNKFICQFHICHVITVKLSGLFSTTVIITSVYIHQSVYKYLLFYTMSKLDTVRCLLHTDNGDHPHQISYKVSKCVLTIATHTKSQR